MTGSRNIYTLAILAVSVTCVLICPSMLAQENAQPARHEQDILRLISSKPILSMGIRNPTELIKKIQVISDRENLTSRLNIDNMVDTICEIARLQGCIDKSKPVVLSLGARNLWSVSLQVSVTDTDTVATNLELSAEQLRRGETYKIPNPVRYLFSSFKYARLTGTQLAMGSSEALLDMPPLEDSLLKNLSAKDQESLLSQDMVVVFGQSAFEGECRSLLDYVLNEGEPNDPDYDHTIGNVLDDLKYVVSGIHFEKGITTTTIASLKNSDKEALLGELFDDTQDATLARMPKGKILVTHALQADGNTTGGLLGSLLSKVRNLISDQITRLPIDSEAYQLDGLLTEALDRIKGGHLVLYESSNKQRYGDFNLLGVFNTDEPNAFLSDLTGLVPFVNLASMSEVEAAVAFPEEKIEKLVSELGDLHFQRRQLAKLKLRLLGTRARTALEKATKTNDLELRLAAKDLLETLKLNATSGRSDLLKGGLFKKLKPIFTYAGQQEKSGGTNSGVLTMRFQSDVQQSRSQMETLFGPAWQTLRIATVGKKVLLLVGSETSILEDAIHNQTLPDSALTSHKACQSFRLRAKNETVFEFHLAISRLAYLLDLGIEENSSAAEKEIDRVSSFGLTIGEKRIRLDTYTPPQDIKASLEGGIPQLLQ